MPETAFEGGFTEPVFQSQEVFRTLMDVMSRPGIAVPLMPSVRPPSGVNAVAGVILLALADADTPVWLDPSLDADGVVASWIAFHTGAPVTADRNEADFALVTDLEQLRDLGSFALGSQEYPDRSTTLILCVEDFDSGKGFNLAGPGIRDVVQFSPRPLPPRFGEQWQANGARFPRGVDLVFAAPHAVAAMPRTTRILENGSL